MNKILLSVLALACLPWGSAFAITSDADTTLLLHFENTANGAAGEVPATNSGLGYAAGISGQGAQFSNGTQLTYAAAGNFNPTRGTVECWIKPSWAGNDGNSHTILRQGDGGGVIILKDGANNLRAVFNRYSANGQPEVGVGYNVGDWAAGSWHHVAFTFGDGLLRLFTDGVQRVETAVGALPNVAGATFQIGSDGAGAFANGLLDELRISNRPRTPAEVSSSFTSDLPGVTAISLTPSSATIWPTWTFTPTIQATTAIGVVALPPTAITWANPSPGVAKIDAEGRIVGVAGGTDALTAQFRGKTAPFSLTVRTPARAAENIPVTPELANPMANAVFDIPVVVISYLPTNDGVNMDTAESGGEGGLNTVSAARAKIETMSRQTKFSLSEASRYHGYKNSTARPSLGYRVVRNIVVYEPLPPGKAAGGGAHFADYNQILNRFGGEQLVMGQNVKEVWLWGYHTGAIVPAESNMSSPTTGDISNSNRFQDDLPVYDRTYVLYNYNYGRSQNEAVHNHGHQLESMFGYVCQQQDGNDNLFWDKFAGRANGVFQKGRCGNTHFPPNADADYDYNNNTPVLSDCQDWRPDNGGQKLMVSAQTWGSLTYAWPGGPPGGQTEAQYYIFWMQNMPGLQNAIPYGSETMRNWWEYVADWDGAIRRHDGLHKLRDNGRTDFNGDGKQDFLFFNPSTRKTVVWYLDGVSFAGYAPALTIPTGYELKCAADLDGDGQPDYVLFSPSTGQTSIWYLHGTAYAGSAPGPTLPSGWALAAVKDFNGDQKPDYLLYNASTRQTAVWYLNGPKYVSNASGPSAPAGFALVGAGDFNGDGKPDYVLSNPANGQGVIWYLNGLTYAGGVSLPATPAGWALVGIADFNGDGKNDLAYFDAGPAHTYVRYFNGAAYTGSAPAPALPAGWELISP